MAAGFRFGVSSVRSRRGGGGGPSSHTEVCMTPHRYAQAWFPWWREEHGGLGVGKKQQEKDGEETGGERRSQIVG